MNGLPFLRWEPSNQMFRQKFKGEGDCLISDGLSVSAEDFHLLNDSVGVDNPNHTVPTGFAALPPPGPAMPEILRA